MSTPVKRHDIFYCHDLVIQVENTLFRVPRYVFQGSDVFQDMFSIPQASLENAEGSSDESPLILHGYLANDFEQLLRILVPKQHPPRLPKLTQSEWMSVAKLADIWNFTYVRGIAISKTWRHVKDDPIAQIIVAKQLNIPHWFVPALNELAKRPDPLSPDEVSRLMVLGTAQGVCLFALKLSRVRESCELDFKSLPEPEYCSWRVNHANLYPVCTSHQGLVQAHCCRAEYQNWRNKHLSRTPDQRRAQHNFEEKISEVFECVEVEEPPPSGQVYYADDDDDDYNGPRVLLWEPVSPTWTIPQPFSWNFDLP